MSSSTSSSSPVMVAISPSPVSLSPSIHSPLHRQVMIHTSSPAAQRYSHRLSPSPPSSPLLAFTGLPSTSTRPLSPSLRYSPTLSTVQPAWGGASPPKVGFQVLGTSPVKLRIHSNKVGPARTSSAPSLMSSANADGYAKKPILKVQDSSASSPFVASSPTSASSAASADISLASLPTTSPSVDISSSSAVSIDTTKPTRKTIRFSKTIEDVCLFSSDDTPRDVQTGNRYKVSDTDTSSPLSPPSPQQQQPTRHWCLLSKTTPSSSTPLHPFTNIALESVRLLENADGTRLLLFCTLLIRNVSYEKQVGAVYSLDGWATSHKVSGGKWKGVAAEGVDRFTMEVEVDSTHLEKSERDEKRLRVEFAVKCTMGGVDYWDNRNGMNHVVEAVQVSNAKQGTVTFQTKPSGQRKKSSLNLDKEALLAYAAARRAAATYAARLGEAMAAEVRNMEGVRRVQGLFEKASSSPAVQPQQQQVNKNVRVVREDGRGLSMPVYERTEVPFSCSPLY
ncbi:hypothetical protein HDU97_009348 [Phlyctochytrium planicorne]|nr:hypothetical protein HDU97_009348 [Phlyctochytrium planicorne]